MKTTPFFARDLVAIAVVAAALPANALADSETTLTLPAIDVVGYGEDDRSRQTGAVVVITREEIERLQPSSTEDVLRRIPGINVKTEEESAVVSNIGIRGLSASESKSLVLEAVFRLRPACSSEMTATTIPVFSAWKVLRCSRDRRPCATALDDRRGDQLQDQNT
ncbi:TonB-dependent receptor plug domain-containing protein [Halopseudomonas pachastrellae]|nr:TonB-dependent receptor plug domain-containing protein [Halopseudomonas pachastrellae]